jgi:hypothetical protein
MATLDALGNLQPEERDILPREVAHKTDDHPEVTRMIDEINPTIKTAEDLADAVEKVDALRRQLADETNEDNPHIAPSVNEAEDESEASKPQPRKLGKQTVQGPAEK